MLWKTRSSEDSRTVDKDHQQGNWEGADRMREDLEVYRLAKKLANEIWHIVKEWDSFAKDTTEKQIVRSINSICVKMAEGRGAYNFSDNRRFIKIFIGSLYKTISWLRLAYVRQLLTHEQVAILKPIIDELSPKLNAYLKSRGNSQFPILYSQAK